MYLFKIYAMNIAITFLLFMFRIILMYCPVENRFLGQTPPGDRPQIFPLATSRGSFAAERIAISSDGREIYYSEIKAYYPTRRDSIKRYVCTEGKWTGPFTLFEGNAPALSVTGDTMFIERPDPEEAYGMYICVRNAGGWTAPKRILSKIEGAHYYQTAGKNHAYISAKMNTGCGMNDWCIVSNALSDTSIVSLGKPLNTMNDNLDFFVARDESYMLVTNRPDLGISFRRTDGTWTNPQSLGRKINFGLASWGPWVTPDNKYMFYTTGTKPDYSDVGVFWVRFDAIADSIKKACIDINIADQGRVNSD